VRRRLLAQRIEWCANQFKQWRRIATRYDKRVANYRAAVVIAELMI
jgi:transposase